MKKKIYCFLSTAILLGSISSSAFASTTPKNINENNTLVQNKIHTDSTKCEEEEALINFLNDNGVDILTQKKLLNKYQKGCMWDSWKSCDKYEKKISENGKIKYIFKDGSICVYDVEKAVPSRKKASVSMWEGQTSTNGNRKYYTNAKVKFSNGRVRAYFYADFCEVTGGRSSISDVYGAIVDVKGGSYKKKVLDKVKPSEDGRTGAQATLTFTAVYKSESVEGGAYGASIHVSGGSGTQDFRLQLNVLNGDHNARVYY